MSESAPSVFDYTDYRVFLKDWYDHRKATEPGFSYRVFARRAGLSSQSLLVHVMKGERNLTDASLEALCVGLELDEAERDFFGLIVAFCQATNDEDRTAAWEEVMATTHFRAARPLEGAVWSSVARWYAAAVHELVRTEGFRPDPAWMVTRLWPEADVNKVREAFEGLVDVGLIRREPDGTWTTVEVALATEPQTIGLAVSAFHRSLLHHAAAAIEAVPREQRHLGALTVAIPASVVPRLKREIAAFEQRMLSLCDHAEGERDSVYQLGTQLFPLTTPDAP